MRRPQKSRPNDRELQPQGGAHGCSTSRAPTASGLAAPMCLRTMTSQGNHGRRPHSVCNFCANLTLPRQALVCAQHLRRCGRTVVGNMTGPASLMAKLSRASMALPSASAPTLANVSTESSRDCWMISSTTAAGTARPRTDRCAAHSTAPSPCSMGYANMRMPSTTMMRLRLPASTATRTSSTVN